MDDLERFSQELSDTLRHLCDPDHQPSGLVCRVIGVEYTDGIAPVRSALLRSIERLASDAALPPDSATARDLQVLRHRFVRDLTQLATAARLHMSLRTVQRAQRRGARFLAEALWQEGLIRTQQEGSGTPRPRTPVTGASEGPAGWQAQASAELASLRKSAPDAQADVVAVIDGALRVARVAGLGDDIVLEAGETEAGLHATMHPSALRQVLLITISELGRQIRSSGEIVLTAQRSGDWIRVAFTGCPITGSGVLDLSLAQGFLGKRVAWRREGETVSVWMDLPAVLPPERRITVLAIDDNPDWISLYESYCAGTPYKLVPLAEGRQALEVIAATRPDIILLDVMLPDIDGWDLLLDLHNSPLSRATPTIICSVMKGEDLAPALGATLYLRKPIYRQGLLDAFEYALSQVAAESERPAPRTS
jgi:CheY-like chemotaxis protein